MGRARVCGSRCHEAESSPVQCRCWCGGAFHGDGAAGARAAFVDSFGAPPSAEPRDDAPAELRARFDAALEAVRSSRPPVEDRRPPPPKPRATPRPAAGRRRPLRPEARERSEVRAARAPALLVCDHRGTHYHCEHCCPTATCPWHSRMQKMTKETLC